MSTNNQPTAAAMRAATIIETGYIPPEYVTMETQIGLAQLIDAETRLPDIRHFIEVVLEDNPCGDISIVGHELLDAIERE